MTLEDRISIIRGVVASKKVAETVTLIAVTKTLDISQTEQAIQAGLTVLGENRLQVAEPKITALSSLYPVQWHFIGPVQTNKAKKIVSLFSFIHAVDRWEVLDHLEKSASQAQKELDYLLEVNISGEETKHGFSPDVLKQTITKIKDYKFLKFQGYMTMAPNTDNKEVVRKVFKGLKTFAESMKEQEGIAWRHLSMGMSQDFEIALEEGATMVRLGSVLFN